MTGMRTTSARSLKDSGNLCSSAAATLFSAHNQLFQRPGCAAVAVGAWRSSEEFPSRVMSSAARCTSHPSAPTSSHQFFTSWEALTGEVIVIITCMFKRCCARVSAL